jgi:4-aminobutyrate aminotransferase/(S)-3-amino-2-methylpropionate transaminase
MSAMPVQDNGSSLSSALLARRAAVVCPGVPTGTRFAIGSAAGAVLTDLDGNEVIDLASGIGVMTGGHSDPAVVAAIAEQAARLQHVCMHIATYEGYVALCERLVGLLPHGERTMAMLVNSGAEAVENAIKIARQVTGRPAVLCYSGAFHGRTLLAMTLTSKVGYKTGCGPFAPEVYRVPFPDALRNRGHADLDRFAHTELARLTGFFKTHVAASDVAAIIVEPVQGEGGFVPLPRAYLQGLRALCDEHGILLVLDEVQSGFGRAGAWAAHQIYGVTPDLSTYAKAMGGGLPIAAVVGKASILQQVTPGTVGGTFGGNPIACAAALAAIDSMERQDLCARADGMGARIRSSLEALQRRFPAIVDVRGLGAMIAMEFCDDGDLSRPASAAVASIIQACHRQGVLVIAAGVHANILRILAPLTISDALLDRALHVIELSTAEVLS